MSAAEQGTNMDRHFLQIHEFIQMRNNDDGQVFIILRLEGDDRGAQTFSEGLSVDRAEQEVVWWTQLQV